MIYSIDDLNPCNPVLIINGSEIELSLFTLQIEQRFKEKFESTSKALDIFHNEPKRIIEFIWFFVKDKSRFNYSINAFSQFIFSSSQDMIELGKDLTKAFYACISKAMPEIKNKKRIAEFNELTAGGKSPEICYAKYYDKVAARYGYTIEQFYALTLRQVHILLTTVNDKEYDELEVQASLVGKKLKPRITVDDIGEEDEKEQEKDALEMLKRLQDDYKKKQGK